MSIPTSNAAPVQANSAPSQSEGGNSFSVGANPMDGGPNPFASAPQQQAPQQQQQQSSPSGIPNSANPPSPEPRQRGVIPTRAERSEGGHPLDKYMQRSDNGPNSNGQQPANGQQQPASAPAAKAPDVFDYKVEDYSKVLGQNDFVGEITPEVMTAIQQGDAGALKALINQAIINGGSQSAFVSSQVNKHGVNQYIDNFSNNKLPEFLNNHSFEQSWQQMDNDILQHPSVQPLAKGKMEEFRAQYPEASNQEIMQATQEYFKDLAAAFSGQQAPEQPAARKPNGLGEFFNS